MIRLRLLVLAAGAGALLGALPAVASSSAAPGQDEVRAQALLVQAARAATTRRWSGTQYVGTWRGTTQTSAVLDVTHRPGSGSTVRDGDGSAVVTPELDARLLGLLAAHYDLVVAGRGRCVGRSAHVVEARRPGVTGRGAVAGRFWLDADSGLVLRREVYDERGARLRSSAFVDLSVDPPAPQVQAVAQEAPAPEPALPDAAWAPPRSLPGGMQLFDVRLRAHGRGEVLHLAYSDGLSTLSLFAQRGALPERPKAGFSAQRLHGTRAWVQPAAPERVVWAGEGQVFTIVSDAAPETVGAAVGALPREPAPGRGLLARLVRGLQRVGSWLTPS